MIATVNAKIGFLILFFPKFTRYFKLELFSLVCPLFSPMPPLPKRI